ncbi:hypothetical protein D0Y65_030660 [Glycine soja]|uniref:Uncharacterized protein n=1 Tax=Glycine soja TaxID=3848 RepID=A0A445I4Q6_GLYSO|nr:hypothetical protein D0Y65_030660 [Glycine soja]
MDTNSYDLGNGAKSIVNMKQVTSNRFEIFIDEDDVSTTKVDMEVVPNTPMDIQLEKRLQEQYDTMLAQEEMMWFQQLREQWVNFALGLDGFRPIFYQTYWDTAGNEVWDLVAQAFATREINPGLEETQVIPIPKVNNPTTLKDFHPISLCNGLLKTYPSTSTSLSVKWNNEMLESFSPKRVQKHHKIFWFPRYRSRHARCCNGWEYLGGKSLLTIGSKMSMAFAAETLDSTHVSSSSGEGSDIKDNIRLNKAYDPSHDLCIFDLPFGTCLLMRSFVRSKINSVKMIPKLLAFDKDSELKCPDFPKDNHVANTASFWFLCPNGFSISFLAYVLFTKIINFPPYCLYNNGGMMEKSLFLQCQAVSQKLSQQFLPMWMLQQILADLKRQKQGHLCAARLKHHQRYSEFSVMDLFCGDEPNTAAEKCPTCEDHVSFSLEGLGKVGTETPVHSPEQRARSSAIAMKEMDMSEPHSSFSKSELENDLDFYVASRSRLGGNFNAQNLIPEDVKDKSSLLSEESSSHAAGNITYQSLSDS